MAKSESTPAPIPLEDAIKAVQVAMEMEAKATKAPWNAVGGAELIICAKTSSCAWFVFPANAAFIVLARNTYRSMLEYLNEFLLFEAEIHTDVDESYGMYGMLSALISHLEATVPDWRTR